MGFGLIMRSHNDSQIKWINYEMKRRNIFEYQLCVENDCYACDKYGNFYSVCKRQYSKSGNLIEHYEVNKLKGSKDKYGYMTYRISINGVKKHLKAHRMMMNAWIGVNPNLVVNHIDGNKANNTLSNLEWCTVAENNLHAIATGLVNTHLQRKKSIIPISEWVSIYILNKHCGYSFSELGRMNHCARDTIKAIVNRINGIMPKEK